MNELIGKWYRWKNEKGHMIKKSYAKKKSKVCAECLVKILFFSTCGENNDAFNWI
jgi:hypothetical protein